ncbi:MAG: hypothetical protein DRI32_03590 [Chloroflexi bacterium]|nr:MAG: hypothetical protein DRI32_03590 [Chloroflexota bacterium]
MFIASAYFKWGVSFYFFLFQNPSSIMAYDGGGVCEGLAKCTLWCSEASTEGSANFAYLWHIRSIAHTHPSERTTHFHDFPSFHPFTPFFSK